MAESEYIRKDLEFNRDDIKSLAQKLDSVASQLDASERALLLAIFSAARDHVSLRTPPQGSDLGGPTLADLQAEILQAFDPSDDNLGDIHVIQYRIGPEPIIPPPPPPVPSPPPVQPTPPPSSEPPTQP
jgi:hypothetical protein